MSTLGREPTGTGDDTSWGDPIGPLDLQWAAPTVDPPPDAGDGRPPRRSPGAGERLDPTTSTRIAAPTLARPHPAAPTGGHARPKARRIRYRIGAWRRTRSLVELLVLSAILAAVLAGVLGAGIAGLVDALHRATRGG